MNQQSTGNSSNKFGKNITFCVKCQSDDISADKEGFVCHSCGTKGTFEWYND
ncbi:MAG: hypothetical protein ACR2LL_11185 [Nitrosopumilus sp.]|uniref:hypothetical protein n=1 Tax=Nitrosopumilus sp. TaxID=2024843 RepID=UPI0029305C75|nr:hypothetical protein [Nitrosopumilus sp.]